MSPLKLKVFVITISKNFMTGHPRKGEATNFKDQVLSGQKIHTIRAGEYWNKVIDQVNAGKALLSVREWSGKPYKSKQVEVCQFTKLGKQTFEFVSKGFPWKSIHIDGRPIDPDKLCDVAENDGLSKSDFLAWFKYPKDFNGTIIHFTDFKY